MKYRSLVVLFLLSFLFPPEALPAEDAKSAEVLPLLIQTALANNPELKASQSEQSLESATIGYRVNKVDFLTLLELCHPIQLRAGVLRFAGRLPDETGAAGGAGGEGTAVGANPFFLEEA